MHFSGLRELSGTSYKSFKNRFRRHLKGAQCLKYHGAGNWWHYEWCVDAGVRQFHPANAQNGEQETEVVLGRYPSGKQQVLHIHPVENLSQLRDPDYMGYYALQKYKEGDVCDEPNAAAKHRSVNIHYKCCVYRANETYIEQLHEPSLCEYTMTVCTPVACGLMQNDQYVLGAATRVGEDERLLLVETVKDMFYHAYFGYLENAFPLDALLPISCRGETFELGKIQMLTLIDTLDTLAILEDATEFQRAVKLVISRADFNLDTEVSVFETTIRVLGGLLSAHLFAIDEKLALYPPEVYQNELLELAVDLGERLMPAFKTATGIPYGTVNLRNGVPEGETPIASTAGAGSLSMEFTMLSVLTGDVKYANAARGAVRALFQRRSTLGLLGKHIDTRTGDWTETISGPGSNSDSFYEYLLKMYMTFNDEESLAMFATVYPAVLQHNLHGDWYTDVSMWNGCGNGAVLFENLVAFWPGMQVSVGHFHSATKSINSFYRVWREYGFIPEQFNVLEWKPLRGRGSQYPLRPELIESTFYMHEATNDSSWLRAGAHFVHSLQKHSKTKCGYATIADIETKQQEDNMPSFFLSETCKYLYLLFNTTHFYRRGNYVMTTEAHPFPILPAKLVDPIIHSSLYTNKTVTATVDHNGDVMATTTTNSSTSAYKIHQLQCLAHQFWDPFHYQIRYEGNVVEKTPRCHQIAAAKTLKATPVKTTVPSADKASASKPLLETLGDWLPELEKRLGKTLGEFNLDTSSLMNGNIDDLVNINPDVPESDHEWIKSLLDENRSEFFGKKSFRTIYGGAKFGHFRIDQLDNTMRITREVTSEWIETSGLGDPAHLLVSYGKEARLQELEQPQHGEHAHELEFTKHLVYEMQSDYSLPIERSCRLNVLVTPDREERPELRYSFPCVAAGFGLTDSLKESRTFPAAELEVAKPLDACGWLANDGIKGKIVVATRGVCFFESKARNAGRRGAAGVIIVNNEASDRIMVMGGSGGMDEDDVDAMDDEAASIPVVMVPRRLGEWFDQQLALAWQQMDLLTVEVELTVRDTRTKAENEAQQPVEYPFVAGLATNLQVFGPEWGVHLQLSDNGGKGKQGESYTISIVETSSRGPAKAEENVTAP
uniref:alpha-1,2-Mannosidase n=1 Tax=Globisporangium ultimum (strain ATCC 200006 / CBS 805.95 / DAOM BR144) TaxID=431595 RepID=K3WIG8_GLOUD